ncbi:MAG: LamG-like jellyroll fold domain-containing protein, partial [Methylophagaceae bacterium]
ASVSGLPTGLSIYGGLAIGLNNGSTSISGTPNQTGIFNYTVTISGATTSQVVTGTITVNADASNSLPIPDYLPTNGLIAWYPFNGNANDESGNSLNLSINGPSLSADRYGTSDSAYIFDGEQQAAQYLILSDIDQIKNNEFTYSVWFNSSEFYPNALGARPRDYVNFNAQGIFSINSNDWDVGPALSMFLKNHENETLGAGTWTPQGSSEAGLSPSVETNTWYNAVYTYGNGTTKVYINGILKSTFLSSIDYNNQYDFVIGGQRNGDNMDVMGGFNGKIDDVGIWDKVLTQAEVIQLYTGVIDTVSPTVTLSHNASASAIVSSGDAVTVTATFSEAMRATPSVSISGQAIADVAMSATASPSIWAYTWSVSSSATTEYSVTVSGTDLAGNTYSGTNSLTFTSALPGYLPTNGLIAWYPFNGNANDESGNSKHGTVLNDPQLTQDRNGNTQSAYDFDWDGITGYGSDWKRIDLDHDFNLGSTFSFNVWINPETYYWTGNNSK